MAGKGGTAVLVAVAIGVGLGLVDQSSTASSTSSSPTSPTASSTAASTAASTASSTASSTVVATASSGSTVDVTTRTETAPAPLASCPGSVVGQHTANDLTVRISYDARSGGLNCVTAVHTGPVTPPGYLQAEIRIADYTGTSWPRYASTTGAPGVAEVGGAYLIGTDGRCVTGTATYFPAGADGGSSTSVSLSGIGCG
jgi:hypothetical protein